MIELRTLGALELSSADGTPLDSVLAQPRRTALLCHLAVGERSGFRRRDALYAMFWPEHDTRQARHALRQSLYFLRRALGADAIVSRGDDDLALAPDRVRCDANDFLGAMEDRQFEAALALYRGDLLPAFHISDAPDFDRWLDDERLRLRRLGIRAAVALSEAREQNADTLGAAEWARRAAELSPGDERALRRFVLLLDRLGDKAAAVAAYEAFAVDLERTYELKPSDETRALIARIRDARSGSGPDRSAAAIDVASTRPAATPAGQPVETGTLAATDDSVRSPTSNAFSRRRRTPVGAWALAGVALMVVGAGGWLIASARSTSTSSLREHVLVADFVESKGDSAYGDLVTLALRNELARSPLLVVAGRERIADALRRMRVAPDARLSSAVAREVAMREEIKVVVEGEVRAVGTGVALSASVIEAETGELIHGAFETARDSTEIPAAIQRLSTSLREGIGEALSSIKGGPPLWSFTTTSLPALRKHMAAIRARTGGEYLRAIRLLDEAIALDSGFAHAYLSIAAQREGAGLPRGRMERHLARVYGWRDRLTARERSAVEGYYHLYVKGDLPSAIHALSEHFEEQKRLREGGWFSLLGDVLELRGELAAADNVLAEGIPLLPSLPASTIRVRVLHALGNEAEAARVLDALLRQSPEHPWGLHLRVRFLADSGRYDEGHTVAKRIRQDMGLKNGAWAQAQLDAVRGRLAESVSHLREVQNHALALGELGAAVEVAAAIARLRLLSGDSAAAAEADQLLIQHSLDTVDVLSRPYLPLAVFYAESGQPRRAKEWLDHYEQDFPREFRGPDVWMLHRVRAAVYRAQGRHAAELAELQQASSIPAIRVGLFDEPLVRMADHPLLARAYYDAGLPDSAIAVYERYLPLRTLSRGSTDAFELGSALEHVGLLYEKRGDRVRAAAVYRRFADLWSGADAALQPRVSAARRRVVALDTQAGRGAEVAR